MLLIRKLLLINQAVRVIQPSTISHTQETSVKGLIKITPNTFVSLFYASTPSFSRPMAPTRLANPGWKDKGFP